MRPFAVLMGLLISIGLLSYVAYRWDSATELLVGKLRDSSKVRAVPPLDPVELAELPAPVARYLRTVLPADGTDVLYAGEFTQRGNFLLPGRGYQPFFALEYISVQPAGFVWDAKIKAAPGVSLRGRDGFVKGTGSMAARLSAILPLFSRSGTPDLNAGALQRYLAEAAWLPTALLPRHGVRWISLGDRSARAAVTAGQTTVSLDFFFNEQHLIERVYTVGRSRGGVPTPWEATFSNYERRGGVLIPTRVEVAWLLPEGREVYCRGEIVDSSFEYAPAVRIPTKAAA